MKLAVVDTQGYVIDGAFVPKELSILIGSKTLHLIFKPLIPFHELSHKDKRTTRYLETHHHGLKYDGGFVEYENGLIKNVFRDVDVVYVSGHQKYDFLSTLHNNVINVENFGWSPPKLKKGRPLCLGHSEGDFMCSARNCEILKNWLINFLPH